MVPVQLSSLSDFEREISALQNAAKAGRDEDGMLRFQALYRQLKAKAGFFSGYQLRTLKEKVTKLEQAFACRGESIPGQLEIEPLSGLKTASSAGAPDLPADARLLIADLTDVSESYEVGGRDVLVERCKDCRVSLVGEPVSLKVSGCSRLALLTSAVCSGSVYVSACQDCQLCLGGEQVRIHDSHTCCISLFTRSSCILESSHGLSIGPMSAAEENQWRNITDFSFGLASYCIKE